jgi:tight adherence protein B
VSVERVEELASVVQRLSVLLAAGVSPASAWTYVDSSSHAALVEAVIASSGGSISSAIVAGASALPESEQEFARGLAAAWQVATDAGAPLARSLANFAATLRSLADAEREVQVALAGPTATARLVLFLPVVGILFGLLLGFNTLGTLFTTGPGLFCLVTGAALLVGAGKWNRRMVRGAENRELTPGLRCDLMAIAVSGGGSLDRAKAAVHAALESCGLDPEREVETVARILELSRRAGVPAAALLRSQAGELRRTARATAQKATAVLAVRLMLPLGLCVLPAFMLLGVAPLLISVISSTVLSL